MYVIQPYDCQTYKNWVYYYYTFNWNWQAAGDGLRMSAQLDSFAPVVDVQGAKYYNIINRYSKILATPLVISFQSV